MAVCLFHDPSHKEVIQRVIGDALTEAKRSTSFDTRPSACMVDIPLVQKRHRKLFVFAQEFFDVILNLNAGISGAAFNSDWRRNLKASFRPYECGRSRCKGNSGFLASFRGYYPRLLMLVFHSSSPDRRETSRDVPVLTRCCGSLSGDATEQLTALHVALRAILPQKYGEEL